jgi:tRNA-guanine family transglycosylase
MLETVFGAGLKERLAISGPLMLDSGGFTMMMRGESLSVRDVVTAFRAVAADVVVSLDYPPLPTDPVELRLHKYHLTLENVRYMRDELEGERIAPVVHGLSPEELETNCLAISSVLSHPKWICIGGLVPILRRMGSPDGKGALARIVVETAIGIVRHAFPASTLHVLGVGSPRTIAAVFESGADSVDSIGWRRAAGFGTIFLPGGSERFVADRDRKRAGSRKMLTPSEIDLLSRCACPACAGIETIEGRLSSLAESYLARAAHNASVLIGEAKNSTPLVACDRLRRVSKRTPHPEGV